MKQFVSALSQRLRGTRPETSFESFRHFLPELLRLTSPTRILEFGPGTSTRLFLEHSTASIVSIETSSRWHGRYAREFGSEPRVDLRLREPNWDMSDLGADVGSGFDWVFVDGGARQEALVQCQPLIAAGGLVVVHDAHRDDYYWAMLRYRFLFPPERHSCVLTDDAETFRTVVLGLEPDYETMSPYSSKPYRRAYFDDLVARSQRDRASAGIAPDERG